MANNTQTAPEPGLTGPEPSMTNLVTGIIHDTQDLIKQQLALFKHEVKADLTKTKDAAISIGIGIGVILLGGIFLCLMVVELLVWAFPRLPMWGSYAIVGGALVVIGVLLLYVGKAKMQSFNPLPDESVGALKENVQWIMKPK